MKRELLFVTTVGLANLGAACGGKEEPDMDCIAVDAENWKSGSATPTPDDAAEYLDVSTQDILVGKIGGAVCVNSIQRSQLFGPQGIRTVGGLEDGVSDTCLAIGAVTRSEDFLSTKNPIFICPAE